MIKRVLAGLALAATLLVVISATAGADPEAGEVTADDVAIAAPGGTTLAGTVVSPVDAVGAMPAMVLVHGSGEGRRERLRPLAEELAGRGVVTLIYDKRTDGYGPRTRNYSVLADDALAAHAVLAEWNGVDPERVGLWGVSEGGWVVPLAASRSDAVDFVITVAANTITPAQQEQWNLGSKLDHHGVTGSLQRAYGLTLTRQVMGNGLFAEAEYDPLPALRALRQPLLALWGEYDRLTPPAESLTTFRSVLDDVGHPSHVLRVIAGADHALHETSDGYTNTGSWAPGYLDVMTSWIEDLADGNPPPSAADDPPPQDRATMPVEPLAWWEAGAVQVAALVLFLVAFLGYGIMSATRRLRRHMIPPVRSAAWLATTGALTVLGLVGYFGYLTVTAAAHVGPVVAGRPVPWLVLQGLAVSSVIALVATVISWRRTGTGARIGTPRALVVTEQARLGVLVGAGAVLVAWSLYWGLLLP